MMSLFFGGVWAAGWAPARPALFHPAAAFPRTHARGMHLVVCVCTPRGQCARADTVRAWVWGLKKRGSRLPSPPSALWRCKSP